MHSQCTTPRNSLCCIVGVGVLIATCAGREPQLDTSADANVSASGDEGAGSGEGEGEGEGEQPDPPDGTLHCFSGHAVCIDVVRSIAEVDINRALSIEATTIPHTPSVQLSLVFDATRVEGLGAVDTVIDPLHYPDGVYPLTLVVSFADGDVQDISDELRLVAQSPSLEPLAFVGDTVVGTPGVAFTWLVSARSSDAFHHTLTAQIDDAPPQLMPNDGTPFPLVVNDVRALPRRVRVRLRAVDDFGNVTTADETWTLTNIKRWLPLGRDNPSDSAEVITVDDGLLIALAGGGVGLRKPDGTVVELPALSGRASRLLVSDEYVVALELNYFANLVHTSTSDPHNSTTLLGGLDVEELWGPPFIDAFGNIAQATGGAGEPLVVHRFTPEGAPLGETTIQCALAVGRERKGYVLPTGRLATAVPAGVLVVDAATGEVEALWPLHPAQDLLGLSYADDEVAVFTLYSGQVGPNAPIGYTHAAFSRTTNTLLWQVSVPEAGTVHRIDGDQFVVITPSRIGWATPNGLSPAFALNAMDDVVPVHGGGQLLISNHIEGTVQLLETSTFEQVWQHEVPCSNYIQKHSVRIPAIDEEVVLAHCSSTVQWHLLTHNGTLIRTFDGPALAARVGAFDDKLWISDVFTLEVRTATTGELVFSLEPPSPGHQEVLVRVDDALLVQADGRLFEVLH